MPTITLTEKAVKEIIHIMADQNMSAETTYVRAGVQGGGCSGYKFLFTLDENYNEAKDTVTEQDGLRILVDKRSILYMEGTTVDFHDSLDRRGFVFDNPLATGRCGCNSSFSV